MSERTILKELQEEGGWQLKKRIPVKKKETCVFLQVPEEVQIETRKEERCDEFLLCAKLMDLAKIKLQIKKKSRNIHVDIEIIENISNRIVVTFPADIKFVCNQN